MPAKKHKSKDLARHSRDCRLCAHSERGAIEAEFINWKPLSKIAKHYGLHRKTLYAHGHATGLFEARRKNIAGALEAFIERTALTVRGSGASFVSACVALSKLNEKGQTVERLAVSRSGLFQDFTIGELEDFARNGVLPARHAGGLMGTPDGSLESLN